MMAVEDDGICPIHEKNQIALYCKTCEVLICTRCVSHGSQSSARHRDHVYLDLTEAYDMLQEDMHELTSGLREDLQEKKKNMQDLQVKLQRLQLSLLRKKTQLGKSTKSLKETVKKQEKSYVASVENLITPSIQSAQQHYTDVEYEVVSGEGLLATAEVLEQTPRENLIDFLKKVSFVKKEMVDLKSKTFTTYKEDADACGKFARVNLHLYREKYLLDRAFTLASQVPNAPQALHSWCVVGHDSASIVWKFNKTDIVKCFNIYYKKFKDTDRGFVNARETVKTIVQRISVKINEVGHDEPNSQIQPAFEAGKNIRNDGLVNGVTTESTGPTNVKDERWDGENDGNDPGTMQQDNSNTSCKDNSKPVSHCNSKAKWFGLSWLLGSARKSEAVENSEEEDTKHGVEDKSDVVSDSDQMEESEKTSIQESTTSNDEEGEKDAKEINTNDKIYTNHKEVQRSQSFVDPCEFWKEMQLSSKEAFVNPHTDKQNKNHGTLPSNRVDKNRGDKTLHHSPVRRSSMTSPNHASSSGRNATPSNYARRRPVRVHSLETARNVVSPLLSKHRSQTPTKYVPQNTRQRISVRSPSPSYTGSSRTEGSKQTSARMSRRDHGVRGKSLPNNATKKSMECTENEDENIKDIYNEKSHLGVVKNGERLGTKPQQKVSSSSVQTQKKGETGTKGKKKWKKNICTVFDESEESCPTETDDSVKNEKQQDTYRKRSNTYTKEEIGQALKKHNTVKKPRKTTKQTIVRTFESEYACMKSMDSAIMQSFSHFKVSRFVLGRVHTTLRNLEDDTNYIVLITAENQSGESEASVLHLKTGSQNESQPSCGRVVKTVHRHRDSWCSSFRNVFSKFCLSVFLCLYMFLVFYLMASNVQSSLCSHLAKEDAETVSRLCPGVMPEELCSKFQTRSIEYCENVMHSDNKYVVELSDGYHDSPLNWFFSLLRSILTK